MKSGLRKSMLRVTVFPILLFGLVITVYCCKQLSDAIREEAKSGLKNIAQMALYMYEEEYPGEYRLDTETSEIYKGDKKVSEAKEILDAYKEVTGAEITIFYKDMRVVTTICDEDGNPIVGTTADSITKKEVITGKKECFYSRTKIGDVEYFSYYCPILDSENECTGMVFTGKPSRYVRKMILEGIVPIIVIVTLAVLAIVLVVWRYSTYFTKALQQLQDFIQKVEHGNFKTKLGRRVAVRDDELGKIGRSAVQMQKALRELVERDSLTGLYNRHYGEYWLHEMKREAEETGISFYVAIADIDHFKKFNDHYGHDCGDMVLQRVSGILNEGMGRWGYAARWGGEEFLLLFPEDSEEQALERIKGIVENVRATRVKYGDEELGITVTIGFTVGDVTVHEDEMVKRADEALYEGKESGRNQIRIYGGGEIN